MIATVAKTVPDSPFYYYHIPYLSGVKFPVKETLDLAKKQAPNIVGCKFTDSDLGDVGLCSKAGYSVLIGADNMLLSSFTAGANGAIGIAFNFAGRVHRNIWDYFNKGDIKTADNWQQISREMSVILGRHGLFFSCKSLMQEWRGLDMGPLRWPHKTYTKQNL